jgi:putative DNA primase/helicase
MAQKHRGHPTEIAALHGKRLVTCNELDAGVRLDEARLKQLTGGDPLTARGMNENFWTFAPTHKLWLAGNHRPRIIGTDEGVWRRPLLVPFTVTIPPEERDRHLAAKLRAELPGILRWAIDGALLWQNVGLAPPEAVRAASAEYRAEQDGLADFIAARCARHQNARTGAAQLNAAYGNWCAEVGEEPVSGTLFGVMLRERGFERVVASGRRFYVGLKLLETVFDDAQAGAP